MMRVAILHYHLRPGGVTRVIELAWTALQAQGVEALVICGEEPPPDSRIPSAFIQVVPELRYGVDAGQGDVLRAAVEAAELRHWRALAEVRHFHNHALGKNFALPLAIAAWARQGCRLLLQIHDFAENGRPANYRKLLEELGGFPGLQSTLYPVADHVGYASLTTADAGRLQQGGLVRPAHLLPNPVALPDGSEPISRSLFAGDRLIVYPTRAIRRKNIGEALLWAAWAEPGEVVILTAGPEQGPDVARHEEWRAFAEKLGLPVMFQAQRTLGRSTADFLLTADLCLTTSVAEGFGMAFLEPWLAGSSLAGRDLPGVTQDFRRAGLSLDALYSRLDVPASALTPEAVRHDIEITVRRSCEAYAVAYKESDVDEAFAHVWREGLMDFGRLTEAHQRVLIAEVVAGGERRRLSSSPDLIQQNRATILSEFSLSRYGERLVAAYGALVVADGAKVDFLDPRRVLAANLSFTDYFATRNS